MDVWSMGRGDKMSRATIQGPELISELRTLIQAARARFATAANAELTILYWRIGRRLLDENLSDGRADYGQRILVTVSQQLEREFGKGFSYSGLTRMVRFAELFPEERIVVSLTQVLSWTHILALLPLKDQMELYLRWLDKHERVPGEESPIGLILCAGADAEQVELLQLDEKSIRIAEYLTELPPVELLRDRLHRAITAAREQAGLPSPEGGVA
jgi:hypothetical protein